MAVASLRARCRRLGVLRLEAGPKATAATFADDAAAERPAQAGGLRASGPRVILDQPAESTAARLVCARELLDRLEDAWVLPPQARRRSA